MGEGVPSFKNPSHDDFSSTGRGHPLLPAMFPDPLGLPWSWKAFKDNRSDGGQQREGGREDGGRRLEESRQQPGLKGG